MCLVMNSTVVSQVCARVTDRCMVVEYQWLSIVDWGRYMHPRDCGRNFEACAGINQNLGKVKIWHGKPVVCPSVDDLWYVRLRLRLRLHPL